MYEIIKKRTLSENVHEYVVFAPRVAKHARAGQFIILRTFEDSERVPFTICDSDAEKGTVAILVQTVGEATKELAGLNEGDALTDFVGPLGKPTDLTEFHKILLVGGGIGGAVIRPQAKALKAAGKSVTSVLGARTKELLVYENELSETSEALFVCTDDGSAGKKGFVTDCVKELLERENHGFDCVVAVGPLGMMRAVCKLTEAFGVHTVVSMNSLMVDGTGMCGCCRVTVGGVVKYACVDGPEFDGHKVDFDEAINRARSFREIEDEHNCRLKASI